MGNWRTVTIIGSCPTNEVDALRSSVDPHRGGEYQNFDCLSTGLGLRGLGNWPAEKIDASGNLAERDYTVENIQNSLERIHKEAPGVRLKIHCGGDYEDPIVVATVTLDNEGVTVGKPEITYIRGTSMDEMQGRLISSLLKRS